MSCSGGLEFWTGILSLSHFPELQSLIDLPARKCSVQGHHFQIFSEKIRPVVCWSNAGELKSIFALTTTAKMKSININLVMQILSVIGSKMQR